MGLFGKMEWVQRFGATVGTVTSALAIYQASTVSLPVLFGAGAYQSKVPLGSAVATNAFTTGGDLFWFKYSTVD